MLHNLHRSLHRSLHHRIHHSPPPYARCTYWGGTLLLALLLLLQTPLSTMAASLDAPSYASPSTSLSLSLPYEPSPISYPYPSGAMAVSLYKDGQRILVGEVADIQGVVYVPVQRFSEHFGRFQVVYTEATEQVVITKDAFSLVVRVGDPYITVNDRPLYTGHEVLSLGGWIFAPLTSLCQALDAQVTLHPGYYEAFVTSGDPDQVPHASQYYRPDQLYWLSRIISAEARGEPFTGQIAVGNVVLNRVRSPLFPNTIYGVIFDTEYGVQFTPVANGHIYDTPTPSAIRAAKVCLEGYSLSRDILYFYNPAIATSSWIGRNRPHVLTIGQHSFYK